MRATADSGTVSFLDLFSGIGAMRLGFERACRAMGLMPRCVGFSEIDAPATSTYLRHFPGTPALGDVRVLAASRAAPSCRVILAGFPCQDASMAGKRQGLEGERGGLFFSLADAIAAIRPAAFLLENVRGLASVGGGKALQAILKVLTLLGYSVRRAFLNSRDFGVPQNRPRIYIVGFLGGEGGFAFPPPTDSSKRLREVLESAPVDPRYYLTERSVERIRRHKARHSAKGNGFGARFIDPDREVSGTLVSSNWGRDREFIADVRMEVLPPADSLTPPISSERFRRLTPAEWERLQGLPAGYTAGQADGHRYRQIGNAVTVSVIEAVARNLLAALGKADAEADGPETRCLVPAVAPSSARPVAVEVCSGCGGLTTGLERAGFEVAVACEIDPDAATSCRLNHPRTRVLVGDIASDGTRHEIAQALGGRRCDLLAAGLPCQAYSISGHRNPNDPRGHLFEHFMALVGRFRPRVAVIENVPGILSMRRPDGSLVTSAIGAAFRELGYVAGHLLLNAADFGDPQCRQRVLIFAWRECGMPGLERTHDEHGRKGLPNWRTVRDAIGDLEDAPEDPSAWHVFTRSSPDFVEVLRRTAVGSGAFATYREAYHRCWPDLPSPTVKGCNGSVFVHYRHPRLMTPLELARLQSFPDSYRFHGAKGAVLRQIGNAVPVGLATAVGKSVLGMLGIGSAAGEGVAQAEEPGRRRQEDAA